MRTFVTPCRPGRVSLFVLLLTLAGGGPRFSLALGAGTTPPEDAAPIAAAAGIIDAYRHLDAPALASLLTDDFHFVSDDPDCPRLASPGFSRSDELAAAWNLFHGIERPGTGRLPAAQSITIGVRSWLVESRSGSPGLPPLTAVVVALGVTLVVAFEDTPSIEAGPWCHVFEVSRGDAATLPGGGHGDPGRYYVRRWSEHTRNDCEGLVAAATGLPPRLGEPDVTASSLGRPRLPAVLDHHSADPTIPRQLVFSLAPNPGRTARLSFGLPSRDRVDPAAFDVAGRRVAQIAQGIFEAGSYTRDWDGRGGDGSRAGPGIYFYRLVVGGQPVRTIRGVRL